MARNTKTGQVLEMMVLPALEMGGYFVEKQVRLGERLGGGKHYADILATKGDESIIVSLKWQQTSGTAEQKVPYEYMCLANTVNLHQDVARGYIVIGGDGWTKHSFFLGDLKEWVNNDANIQVLRLDSFVAKANNGLL